MWVPRQSSITSGDERRNIGNRSVRDETIWQSFEEFYRQNVCTYKYYFKLYRDKKCIQGIKITSWRTLTM